MNVFLSRSRPSRRAVVLVAMAAGFAIRPVAAQGTEQVRRSTTALEFFRCRTDVDMACFRVRGEQANAGADAVTPFRAQLDQTELLGPGGTHSFGMGRVRVLVLFDVSGSMLRDNAIAVTRVPLRQFLTALPEQVSVAIVPFESRNVTQAFSDARFVPARQIGSQLDHLPMPRRNGNTALYSSISLGLRLLDSAKPADGRSVLIVITDGSNDVGHRADGDELGLLDSIGGGREFVRSQIARSRHEVWLIGTGAGVRADELQFLAGNSATARTVPMDPTLLAEQFGLISSAMLPFRTMVYGVVESSKWDLGRRSRAVHIDGLVDSVAIWRPPLVALPTYENTVYMPGSPDSVWLSDDARRLATATVAELSPRLLVGGPLLAMLLVLYLALSRVLAPTGQAGATASPDGDDDRLAPASRHRAPAAPSPSMRTVVEAPPRSPGDITKDSAA